jgi:hypothetical protein
LDGGSCFYFNHIGGKDNDIFECNALFGEKNSVFPPESMKPGAGCRRMAAATAFSSRDILPTFRPLTGRETQQPCPVRDGMLVEQVSTTDNRPVGDGMYPVVFCSMYGLFTDKSLDSAIKITVCLLYGQ